MFSKNRSAMKLSDCFLVGMSSPNADSRQGLHNTVLTEQAAYDFYSQNPFFARNLLGILSHTAGIQLGRGTKLIELNPGALLYQYQIPGGYQGSYYAGSLDVLPTHLGINPQGTDWKTKLIVEKIRTTYVVTEPIQALVSIAERIEDRWSTPTPFQTTGGGYQIFAPSMDKIKQMETVPEIKNPYELKLTDESKVNSITINQEDKDYFAEGVAYLEQQKYKQAIDSFWQAHEQTRQTAERPCSKTNEITKHFNTMLHLAVAYKLDGQDDFAIPFLEKCLTHFREKNRTHLMLYYKTLVHLAQCYRNKACYFDKNKQEPRNYYQDAGLLLEEAIRGLSSELNNKKFTKHKKQTQDALLLQAIAQLDLGVILNLQNKATTTLTNLSHYDICAERKPDETSVKIIKCLEEVISQFSQDNRLFREEIAALENLAYAYLKKGSHEDLARAVQYLNASVELMQKNKDKLNKHDMVLLQRQKLMLGVLENNDKSENEVLLNNVNEEYKTYAQEAKDQLGQWENKLVILRQAFDHIIPKFNPHVLYLMGQKRIAKQNEANESKKERGDAYREKAEEFIRLYWACYRADLNALFKSQKKSLELTYLATAKIDDKQFSSVLDQIKNNKELEQLELRRFTSRDQPDPTGKNRFQLFFETLDEAQKNGQQLRYLGFSGAEPAYDSATKSYKEADIDALVTFLNNNKSLAMVHLELFSINEEQAKKIAGALVNHPRLKAVAVCNFKNEKAADMIIAAVEKNNMILKFIPYGLKSGDDVKSTNMKISAQDRKGIVAARRSRFTDYAVPHNNLTFYARQEDQKVAHVNKTDVLSVKSLSKEIYGYLHPKKRA